MPDAKVITPGEWLWTRRGGLPAAATPSSALAATEAAWMAAREASAEYFYDAGVTHAAVVERESRAVAGRALAAIAADGATTSPIEAAVALSMRRLQQSCRTDHPGLTAASLGESSASWVVVDRPILLGRIPELACESEFSADLQHRVRTASAPVVPPPQPQPMQRQTLRLAPSWWQRRLLGRGCNDDHDVAHRDDSRPASTVRHARSRGLAVRGLLAIPVCLMTVWATARFYEIVAADGPAWCLYPLTTLFAVLFLWLSFSFWTATFGLVALVRRRSIGAVAAAGAFAPAVLPRTAVVMPVYNEQPSTVFPNLRAVARSLQAAGASAVFDLFVLSDTTDPEIRLAEERAWARWARESAAGPRVYYRHRARNVGRKAGNIAEFCRRWGGAYRYLVVLDADSVMTGETLIEMVRRMERDPGIGILQVPPTPVNRQSFFARLQQFASRVYGPVFLEGFALWSQCDGNYWGHNAILRVKPFTDHCELPVLPDDGPLGGEILSHDFVEAALMRRAGWKVCLAHDLDGSYEECPSTMSAFAGRDRRWCQGNLQHLRLLAAEGLHPISRLHLGMGAMAYLSSALWLSFLVITVIGTQAGGSSRAGEAGVPGGGGLFALSMAMLLLPKLWGVIAVQWLPLRERSSGVWDRVVPGVVLETVTSVFIAPIMMLLHTRFVVAALRGQQVKWDAQQRNDCLVSFREALQVHGPQTLFGVVFAGITAWLAPGLLLWLSPVLLGLLVAVPLAMLLGSVRVGRDLARRRLLLIPEETSPPPVLRWRQEALHRWNDDVPQPSGDAFPAVLTDPTSFALHVDLLRAVGDACPMSADDFQVARDAVVADGPQAVPHDLRRAVLDDPAALESLHILARSRASSFPETAPLKNGNVSTAS